MASALQALKSASIKERTTEIEGVPIVVRGLKFGEYHAATRRCALDDGTLDTPQLVEEILLISLYDPDTGELVLADEDKGRVILRQLSSKVIMGLMNICNQLNATETPLPEAVGNLQAPPNGSSRTVSRGSSVSSSGKSRTRRSRK